MNFFNNLKIGRRLALGFFILLALLILVSGTAISRLGVVNAATSDLSTNWLYATRALGEYGAALSTMRRGEALTVMAKSPQDLDQQAQRIAAAKTTAAAAWKRYFGTVNLGEEQRLAQTIQDAQAAYYAALDKNLAIAKSGDRAKTEEIYRSDTRAAFDATMAAVDADVAFQTQGADAAYQLSQDTYSRTLTLVIGLVVLAVLITVAFAWVLTNSIVRPIRRAVEVAETVAAGDLSSVVVVTSTDEAGQLLAALRRMNESLVGIVSQVRNSSDSIATGSTQIATGNADLSQRTEEQASNLQQTAASMEQLTATVKQNADTARQATQLVGGAATAAGEGGEVMDRVVATMGEINDSSRKIADIIGTIDGIAFQTNILALNAAVEAARAGEQGRGFAVVAGEVRALAQRSAQAAKEIKALISTSVEKVEAGSSLVDQAGTTMGEIVAQVKRVSDLIGEISASSEEQSRGISQIGDAVTQLDQVTQQNAALVEESAAAAESLKHQAQQLATTVAGFKLDASSPTRPLPAAPSAPLKRPAPAPARPVLRSAPARVPAKPVIRSGAKPPAPRPAVAAPAMAKPADDGEWTSF